jgi:hypothetical protein
MPSPHQGNHWTNPPYLPPSSLQFTGGANREGPLPAMVSEETLTHAAEESTWYICSHWDGTCAASEESTWGEDACHCMNYMYLDGTFELTHSFDPDETGNQNLLFARVSHNVAMCSN